MVWIRQGSPHEHTVAFEDRDSDGRIDQVKLVGPDEQLIYLSAEEQSNGTAERVVALPLSGSSLLPRQFQDLNFDGIPDIVYVNADPATGSYDKLLIPLDDTFYEIIPERGGGISRGFWIADSDGSKVIVQFDQTDGEWRRLEESRER